MFRNSVIGFVAALAATAAAPADAGGLFGKGGLIRGSVGNFIAKNVQEPVLTPMARGAVVAGGAVVGAAAGSYVGAPVTGGAAGAGIGQGINDLAAGQHY